MKEIIERVKYCQNIIKTMSDELDKDLLIDKFSRGYLLAMLSLARDRLEKLLNNFIKDN